MDVSLLKELIGVPYKPMGRDLSGIDRYGLCLYIYRRMGITLPDYIQYDDTEIETNNLIMREMEATIPNEKLEKPEVGCIIEFNIFGVPSHIGVGRGTDDLNIGGLGQLLGENFANNGRIIDNKNFYHSMPLSGPPGYSFR